MNKFKFLLIFLLLLIFPNQSSYASSLPQEPLPEFNAIAVGFHNLYEITVSVENGQTVARSIYDPADSPHYSYDSETQTWIDNHPGRNQMELTFPPVRESGRTIWKEFQGYEWQEDTKTYVENDQYKAEWNQNLMHYEYVNLPHDEGHPVLWSTMMDYDKEGLNDEEMGMVNYSERYITEDFVLGESGVNFDLFVAADHENMEYFESYPTELASKYYAEMYLEQYPQLEGKHIIVRLIAEDLTSEADILETKRETFFDSSRNKVVGSFNSGYIENIAENTDLITISISYEGDSDITNVRDLQIYLANTIQTGIDGTLNLEKIKKNRDAWLHTFYQILEESEIDDPQELYFVTTK